jgi:lipoprotein-releasing system permease protein
LSTSRKVIIIVKLIKLNLYYFFSSHLNSLKKDSFSYLVSRIAITSIALGLAVMLISFSILEGFQKRIKDKIFSFSGHLQITKYDQNNSFEETPVSTNTALYKNQDFIEGIEKIHVFSLKPGLLKTNEGVNGIVLKGISKDFYKEKFLKNLQEGDFIRFNDTSYSKDILVSRIIADKMRLHVHDTVLIYFVQNPPRFRKLVISGIYESGLEEFDDLIILGDIRLNQKLNNWSDTLVGGYEIFLSDFSRIDEISKKIVDKMEYDMQLEKITDKYIQIFDWLSLLDRNVVIFLALILLVACFNMVSTLSIMIMERTNMIGVLKALGATNKQIRTIFIYNGIFIILKGLLSGNLIGLGLCLVQFVFDLVPLDPENYYMTTVPIEWNWGVIAGLNILTFTLISLVLIIPVMIISNIKPVNSIKFN